jgi:hypothetical protein
MAEFFTPSTTGEGQGGAQILSADFTPLNASGIVRGIERAEARIAANQEKEYERQKEESKERRDKINKLQELQYGGGSEFLRSVSDDIMNDFRKAVVYNGEDIDEAYSKARVGFERVKNAGEATTKVAGLVNENVDNYRTFVNGKWETGSLTPLEIAKSKHDGDWEESLGNFENELTNFGSSPTNMIDAGVNLEKTYLEDKKAAEADKETKQTLLDNGDIKTSETITPKNKKERRDFLLNSPQIQRSVLNETKLQYGVSTIEELEKAIGMPFPQYFKQRVDELFDKEDVVNIKEELPKKEGGGKGVLVEGEDYFIDEGADNPIDPLAYNEPRATEEDATLIAGDKIAYGDFKRLTPKGKYEIFTNTGGEEKIKAEVKEIKYKNGGYYLTVITANPKETGDVQTFSETEIEGTKEYLNQLKAKGLDVESILKPKEQKVLFYQLPDGTRKTPEEVEGILGEIPPDWEIVTEENIKQMDANRSESAKEKEQGAVNEEETDFSQYEVVE